MYKCPNGCDTTEFTQNVQFVQRHHVDEHGNTRWSERPFETDKAWVRCRHCEAAAEWIDTRQLEMFEVQPTLA